MKRHGYIAQRTLEKKNRIADKRSTKQKFNVLNDEKK